MKIRHPVAIKAAGLAAAWAVRLWIGTVRFRYRPMDGDVTPHCRQLRERFIYSFWHEDLLIPAYAFSRPDVHVLISESADGQLIAETCKHLTLRVVSGSTTRGGVKAVRGLMKAAGRTHLVFTPDGPRGPRRRIQPGLVYLAMQTGLRVVPVGFGYQAAWRLRSWDRFVMPCPGSAAVCVTGPAVSVPARLDRHGIEEYRLKLEEAMAQAGQEAERHAARESW
jgi:lysophospholipid acyltransferase (LPLAT)-like uncharacterized protein